MKHTNLINEIYHGRTRPLVDTGIFVFIFLFGVVLALVIGDIIYGAEQMTEKIADLVWK